jgi:hypothetical protein
MTTADSSDRIRVKLRKCQALADDARGDPTTRETAARQAQALMRKHSLQVDGTPVPAPPAPPIDWSTRTSTEAAAAGLQRSVLCADGVFVP